MTPVSLSKITPPQLTNTLPRPRLLNLLKKNTDKKLILILGQAAQGKSTLAASFLEQVPIPSAWVNLGPEESDPVNLFYAIIHSLQQSFKESDCSSLLEYPSRTMGPRDPIGFYREWIRGLAGFISAPVFLALDGLDRLVSDSLAFSFLQVLLEESPPELRLVLSSRQTPPTAFNYQPLKMRQQALVLSNEELAFTRPEIRDFFIRTRKITFKAEPLDKIQQATEGWVGGLILMTEILGRDLALGPAFYLKYGFLTRFRVEAFEYLGREIFGAQSPLVQDMLIRASLVPLVDTSLMRGLSGGVNAEEVLRDFARRNLFVQGIYEPEKGWVFRFHQLFREFLLTRFQETFSVEERSALYRKAAGLLEERGDLESAGTLYLQESDFDSAAGIIKKIGLDLYDQGRTEDLSGFLKSLPEEMVKQEPWLLLLFSMTRRWTEFQQNVERFQKCVSLFEREQDARGAMLSLSFLFEVFTLLGLGWKELSGYLDKAEEWLSSPQAKGLPRERARLWIEVGTAQTYRGNIRSGYQAFQKAYELAKTFGNPVMEARILSESLAVLALLGEFELAGEVAGDLNRLVGTLQNVEPKIWYLMDNILYNTIRGNQENAFDSITEGKRLIVENGIMYLHMVMLFHEIFYHSLLGDPEVNTSRAHEFLDIVVPMGSRFMEGATRTFMGISSYLAYQNERAYERLGEAIEVLSTDQGYSECNLYTARIVYGLLEHRLFRKKEALHDLETVLEYNRRTENFLFQTHAHLALALIRWDYEEKEQAAEHLTAGFQIARGKGYKHFTFLNAQDSVQVCLLVFELEVTEAHDLARELLTQRYAEQAEPELLKLEKDPSPQMRSVGQELLRTIHHHRVPFLEINTLGGLEITRNGNPVGDESWDRLQPKRLLLSLLCHPGGKVSKDTLMEELWPGETTDKAENNFKVTLSRLRKSLETDIHPTFGSSYIHLHNNLVFLDPEFTRTDADEFLIIVDKGNWKERAGDTRGAVEEYAKALNIYRGDFLPLETSLPGVDRRRDELKKTFVETLLRLTKLSEKQGSLKKAAGYCRQALEADPLEEEACRSFMRLCLTLGTFNEALRAFETLKKNLHQELKSQPDPQTQALYTRIREKSAP